VENYNIQQNTARIARFVDDTAICRIFCDRYQLWFVDRHWTITDRHPTYQPLADRVKIRCFAGLLLSI
jgi:hypothetical protein